MENRAAMANLVWRNHTIWATIVVIAGIDVLWAWSVGMRIAPGLTTPLVFAGLISSDKSRLCHGKPNPRITALAGSTAQLLAFTSVASVQIYLTVGSNFPLIDRYLSAPDASSSVWPMAVVRCFPVPAQRAWNA
jgi:hypothetical protein